MKQFNTNNNSLPLADTSEPVPTVSKEGGSKKEIILNKNHWFILSFVFGVFIIILVAINIWWFNKSNSSAIDSNPTLQPSSIPVPSGVQIYSENLDQLNLKALVYNQEGNLYLLEQGSVNPISLTNFSPIKIISDSLFSPDKTKIAFLVLSQEQIDKITIERSTAYEWGAPANIGIINLQTKDYKEITATAFENLAWVNNSELVYSDYAKIYLVDHDTQTSKVLVDDIGDRDGPRNFTKTIPANNYVFYSYGIEPHSQGKREIRRLNLKNTTETSIISNLNGDDFFPIADNKIIVQERLDRTDEILNQSYTTVLSILDTGSGSKVNLPIPPNNTTQNLTYYWSDRIAYTIPNSQNVAVKYTDNVTNKVVVYAPDGSVAKEATFENESNSSHPVLFINDNQFVYFRVIDVDGPHGLGKQRYKTSLLLYDISADTTMTLMENIGSVAVAN